MLPKSTSEWVNVDFIRKVLRHLENDESIEVTNFGTKPAVAKGENHGSIMIRCNVEYSQSDSKIMKKISLIVKVGPVIQDGHKELSENLKGFDTEIKMMTTTLKMMNEILYDDHSRLSPCAFYTVTGNPPLLVIEDLTPLGYRMADRRMGLDLEHCLLALRGLAKFHASSVAVCEKDSMAVTIYNLGLYNAKYPKEWSDAWISSIKKMAHQVLDLTELGDQAKMYSQKISKFADVCYEKAVKSCRPKDGEFSVLNHGDCWVNNMLFRYNNDGKVSEQIFVDFQVCLWSSPAIDLLNFLNTSLAESVELNHQDIIIEEYLFTLTTMMKNLGCKTKAPTIQELKRILEEREIYGFMASFTTLPVILFRKDDMSNIEVQPDSSSTNSVFNDPVYRKIILRRLSKWNARGLFEI